MTDSFDRGLVTALIAASRTFADELERALNGGPASLATTGLRSPPSQWDPLADSPILEPDPNSEVRSPRVMCSLVYIGAIWAINVTEGRGATAKEVSKWAIRAGYQNGRAVTAWSKGKGATHVDDGRWVNSRGKRWSVEWADFLGLTLPDYLLEDLRGSEESDDNFYE
jgi:hypothetical protein